MAITLDITDNGTDTGGVAVITGSLGAANVLYATPAYDGSMQSYAMSQVGSRTGDGTITLAMATGYYWFQLLSAGVPVLGFYKNFTNGIDAVHYRILQAARNRIIATGILAANKVLIKWIPRDTDPEIPNMPIICVSPVGVEQFVGEVTNRDDIVYPTGIVILDKGNQDSVANIPKILLWREKISRAIMSQRLPGITAGATTNIICDVKFDQIVNAHLYAKNILASALGFGVKIRQTRGLV